MRLWRSSVEQIDIRWYWPLLLPLLVHPYPAPGLHERRLHRRVGVPQAQMQVRMRRIGEPVAGVGLQGGQLPRHPGKVAGYVPGYVLRVLWPHSSTSLTPYATRASVRPPEPLPAPAEALPSVASPRPSRRLLTAPPEGPLARVLWQRGRRWP